MNVRYIVADLTSTGQSSAEVLKTSAYAAYGSSPDVQTLRPSLLPVIKRPEPEEVDQEYMHGDRYWSEWDVISLISRAVLRNLWFRLTRHRWRGSNPALLGLDRLGGFWYEYTKYFAYPLHTSDTYTTSQPRVLLSCKPIAFEYIQQLFSRQFGYSIDQVFSQFDSKPLMMDTFFQTFRGILRADGTNVDITVRHPDTHTILERDARTLNVLARIGATLGIKKDIFVPRMVSEVKQRLTQISDLRFAVAGIETMRKSLKKENGFMPRVFTQYCSADVLMTEQLRAPSLADWLRVRDENPELAYGWLRLNRIDLQELGHRFITSFLRQILEEDHFRTDLSPENLLLLRDSKFAFTPTPRFASLDRSFSSLTAERFRAIANRDYSKAVDYLLLSCDKIPRAHARSLREDLVRLHRIYDAHLDLHRTDFPERSFANFSVRAVAIMRRYGVMRNSQYFLIGQAWIHMEESIRYLLPELNFRKEFKCYFAEADKRKLSRLQSQGLNKTLIKGINAVSEQWSFISSQLRRRSQGLHTLNRTAFFISVALRNLRTFCLWTLVLGVLAHQHAFDFIPGYEKTAFGKWSESLRVWRLDEIIIVGFAILFALQLFLRWASQMEDIPDSRAEL